MSRFKVFLLLIPVLAAGCYNGKGDVLVKADGTVMEGTLQSISGGRAVFDCGNAEISGIGRIWLVSAETYTGDIGFSNGEFTAGSERFSRGSVLVVIWGDTEVETGTYSIDASAGWHDTGILMEPGDMLGIKASGMVVTETGSSGPDGQEKFSSSVALAPGATSGQLVFRIGEDGSPVAAGSSWVGESENSGTLRLAVNVPAQGSIEPGGVYTVNVTAGSNGRQPGVTAFYPSSP